MSREERIFCDRCGMESEKVNGVDIVLGFSTGGWGHRDNAVHFTGEICNSCYKEYRNFTPKVKAWLRKKGVLDNVFNSEPTNELGKTWGPDAFIEVPKPNPRPREPR